MLRKIYEELVLIRKELQAIRSGMESNEKCTDEEWNQFMSVLNRMIKYSRQRNRKIGAKC